MNQRHINIKMNKQANINTCLLNQTVPFSPWQTLVHFYSGFCTYLRWQVVFIKDQMKWSIMNVLKMLPQMPSSIMLLGTSWLVHVAYAANEIAALHLNGWLAFTTAFCCAKPSTFLSSTCIDLIRVIIYAICSAAVCLKYLQQKNIYISFMEHFFSEKF